MIKLWKHGIFMLLLYLIFMHIAAVVISFCRADYDESKAPTMPAQEQDALYEVMEAMAGDGDWKSAHPHPCTEDLWPGLVCEGGDDGLLHVTRLDFGYKPNPSCARNATIPDAITKLSHLRSLFIFECFTTINVTIPSSLVKLAPTLQEVSLRANTALVGAIPIELSNLSSLQLLSLSQNSLHGAIPPQISKLTALQHLDLSDNLLSGEVPWELGSLRNLVILDVSANMITGRIPWSLGNLRKLQKLDVSFNMVMGQIPKELGKLQRLEFMAMNENRITGPYPGEMGRMEGLQYLIMDNNPMKCTIPSFLGGYGSLMALSLSNSGYFGTIPDSLGRLVNLTVLSLERNHLTGMIPTGLGHLPRIYQMNLSQNNLSGAIPFTLEFVEKLGRNLDITGNPGLCSHGSLLPLSGPTKGLGLCLGATLGPTTYSHLISTSSAPPDSFSTYSGILCIILYSALSMQSIL